MISVTSVVQLAQSVSIGSERPTKRGRHRIAEAPAQPQLRPGVKNRHIVAVEPRLQLAHGTEPNDVGPVDLDEPRRVEAGRNAPERLARSPRPVSAVHDDVVAAGVEMGQRIASFSQPGIELTKKSLQAGIAASSLETYLPSEGLGQLYLRLLTDNFEEATRARQEGRPAVFRDDR